MRRCVAAFGALLLSGAPVAWAGPDVAFTLRGDLSGTIGTTPLANDPFTWTLVGDLGTPTSVAGFPALPAVSDTITLAGVGTAVPTTQLFAVLAPPLDLFGFLDAVVSQYLVWQSPTFTTFSLSAGPVPVIYARSGPVATSLGELDITGADHLIFEVPEPATLALLAGPLVAMGAVRRRRARR